MVFKATSGFASGSADAKRRASNSVETVIAVHGERDFILCVKAFEIYR